MKRQPQKTAVFVKSGAGATVSPSAVQPGTIMHDTATLITFLKTQAVAPQYIPFAPPTLVTNPAQDAVYLRRNGVTPVFADSGGAGFVGNVEFALFGITGGAGFTARQGLVQLSLGPDVVSVAAPGLGTIQNSAPAAGGAGITALCFTDAAGLFRCAFTFNAGGAKTLQLMALSDQYVVNATIA